MSIEIEPAAELATAGLVARELDGEAGKHAHAQAHGPCANCGSDLHGEYCHCCGQFSHVHRSLWHIVEEALHGLLHFDTKIFRTVPLLFVRPGLLTRRYIDGQRARYVAPFALFLFNVFFLFFVSSLLGGTRSSHGVAGKAEDDRQGLLAQVEARRGRVAEASSDLEGASSASERESAQQELDQAQSELKALSLALAVLDTSTRQRAENKANEPKSTQQEVVDDVQIDLQLESRLPALSHAIDHAQENPALALYKLKGAASKLSFLLVPIALPFLWLMFFWRKDVALYDHAIFVLYSLAFMSLWFGLIALLGSFDFLEGLVTFMVFYPFLHVFLQLKETYQLGMLSAVWRTVALSAVTAVAGALYLLLIMVITFH